MIVHKACFWDSVHPRMQLLQKKVKKKKKQPSGVENLQLFNNKTGHTKKAKRGMMLVWCFKNTNTLLEKRKPASPYSIDALLFFFFYHLRPAVSVRGFLSNIVRLVVEGELTAVEGSLQAAPSSLRTDLSRSAIGRGVWQAAQVFQITLTKPEAVARSLARWSFVQFINCTCAFVLMCLWWKEKTFLCFVPHGCIASFLWTGWPFINILTWRSRCEPLSSDRNPDQ